MAIVDPAIPAVPHLTGPAARDVLDAAVTAAGGRLLDVRVSQVQYRPGQDLVVRYRAEVAWGGREPTSETLLAAAHPGTSFDDAIPVVADTDDGPLRVAVWRWPHDPVLAGLPTAVTAAHLRTALGPHDAVLAGDDLRVEVVAYRPTERAVVRATTAAGTRYVKVLPTSTLATIAERHRLLGDAGIPVPAVTGVHAPAGLLVLEELPGTTLRERLKSGRRPWPEPGEVGRLLGALAAVPGEGLPSAPDRVGDALGHAELLRRVAPSVADVLGRVTAVTATALDTPDARAVVHGDLHEAQLVVDDGGRITGLLDIDDVGSGHPTTDAATLLAHLRFRAVVTDDASSASSIESYADALEAALAGPAGVRDLRVRTAAALVGLATGPFRIQRDGWLGEVHATLDRAAALVDEGFLNFASRPVHTAPPS